MAFTKTNPVAGSDANKLMGTIRTNNDGLESAIAQDHDFITGSTQTGKHNKVLMIQQAADPATSASEMALYKKSDGIYLRPPSSGTALKVTGTDGKWLGAATDMLDEDDFASNSATKAASQQSTLAKMTTDIATSAALMIKKNGTVAFTGDQSMGTKKITNLGDPSANQDADTKAARNAAISAKVGPGTFSPLPMSGDLDEGSVTFPSGFTIKWGYRSSAGTHTFLTPFPTKCLSVVGNPYATDDIQHHINFSNRTAESFKHWGYGNCFWLAIGY